MIKNVLKYNAENIGLKMDLYNMSMQEIIRLSVLFDFVLEEVFEFATPTYQKWLREHIIDYTFTFNFSNSFVKSLGEKIGSNRTLFPYRRSSF